MHRETRGLLSICYPFRTMMETSLMVVFCLVYVCILRETRGLLSICYPFRTIEFSIQMVYVRMHSNKGGLLSLICYLIKTIDGRDVSDGSKYVCRMHSSNQKNYGSSWNEWACYPHYTIDSHQTYGNHIRYTVWTIYLCRETFHSVPKWRHNSQRPLFRFTRSLPMRHRLTRACYKWDKMIDVLEGLLWFCLFECWRLIWLR